MTEQRPIDRAMTASPVMRPERQHPRLDIRVPVMLSLAVALLFFGLGVGGAAYAPIDKGVGLSGSIVVESKVKPVQHQRGGVVQRIEVVEGQMVAAGDSLVTLDTTALDQQLGALQAQSEAASRQLELVRQEAATMTDLMERKLAARSKVLALERQIAEVQKEAAGLTAKIALAEQELERAEIKAPVAGRVLSLQIAGPGAVLQPGQTVLEIVPMSDRLVVEGRLAPSQIENVKPGMPAKVWLTSLSWREQRPLAATLAWMSADSVEDKRTGAPYFTTRVELSETRPEIEKRVALHPGMRAEILLLTGRSTLLDRLLDPLMRNINRAFRG
ncbi:MAG: HlyD family efflux transporter periplasmic adaptor subunit [Hyphomicrobium sp.]